MCSYFIALVRPCVPGSPQVPVEHSPHSPQMSQTQWTGLPPVQVCVAVVEPVQAVPPQSAGVLNEHMHTMIIQQSADVLNVHTTIHKVCLPNCPTLLFVWFCVSDMQELEF